MVTLQILVLSFLVRIQVAQLSGRGILDRFFVLVWWRVGGVLCSLVASWGVYHTPCLYGGVAMMQASVIATIQSVQCTPLATTYGGVPYRCAP